MSNDAKPAQPSPLERFERSMVVDFEKWRDGVGYDLEALRAMSPSELVSTEAMLLSRGISDWRDVEALAYFCTPVAEAALRAALTHSKWEVRNAVARHAPHLLTDAERINALVDALKTRAFFDGLGQTLDLVADFHPAPIVHALLWGALEREGEVAVHFAAMLYFIHGKSEEPFDWAHRPFFLSFNTAGQRERETVFRKLCVDIAVDPTPFLARTKCVPRASGRPDASSESPSQL